MSKRTEIRIWMDGVFDLTHFGHFNAFRLARSLGDFLIVGINDDRSVLHSKGPTILNENVSSTIF